MTNRGSGDGASYRTGIGTSSADTITLLGHDLAHELIGQVSFGELAFWLVAKRPLFFGRASCYEDDNGQMRYAYERTDIIRYGKAQFGLRRLMRRGRWEKLFPWLDDSTPGAPE